jgi:hypothetical protein
MNSHFVENHLIHPEAMNPSFLRSFYHSMGHPQIAQCAIAWKACTRERWDLDRPDDVVVKGCHTWPIYEHAYVMLARFIAL